MVKCFYNCVREITADNSLGNWIEQQSKQDSYWIQLFSSKLFRYKLTAIREEQGETAVFRGKDNMWQRSTCVLSVELSRTGMHYQAKLLTISPQIESKKSYWNILVKDEFLILHNDWCCGIFIHFIFCWKFFHVITFNFISFYSVRRLAWWQPCCKTTKFWIKVTKGHLHAIVKHEKLSLKLIEAFR